MTGHRHFGAVVAAPGFNPLVKPADVLVVTALTIEDRAVSRFHKRPLQINVDVAAYGPVMKLSAAGVLARHQATVARQLLARLNRSMLPISVQMTTAKIWPTPGRLWSQMV